MTGTPYLDELVRRLRMSRLVVGQLARSVATLDGTGTPGGTPWPRELRA